jgi:hypothetical protein
LLEGVHFVGERVAAMAECLTILVFILLVAMGVQLPDQVAVEVLAVRQQ